MPLSRLHGVCCLLIIFWAQSGLWPLMGNHQRNLIEVTRLWFGAHMSAPAPPPRPNGTPPGKVRFLQRFACALASGCPCAPCRRRAAALDAARRPLRCPRFAGFAPARCAAASLPLPSFHRPCSLNSTLPLGETATGRWKEPLARRGAPQPAEQQSIAPEARSAGAELRQRRWGRP